MSGQICSLAYLFFDHCFVSVTVLYSGKNLVRLLVFRHYISKSKSIEKRVVFVTISKLRYQVWKIIKQYQA